MKVYVLFIEDSGCEGYIISGVYTTFEQADRDGQEFYNAHEGMLDYTVESHELMEE